MRKWLSGRASPCQGEGREFESRLPLHEYQGVTDVTLLLCLIKQGLPFRQFWLQYQVKVDIIIFAQTAQLWAGGEEANAVVCKITIHRFDSGLALHMKIKGSCRLARAFFI